MQGVCDPAASDAWDDFWEVSSTDEASTSVRDFGITHFFLCVCSFFFFWGGGLGLRCLKTPFEAPWSRV